MHSLAVWQQNYSQVSSIGLWNKSPAANAPILLNHFTNWMINGALNPFKTNIRAIRSQSHRLEVLREFHECQFISGWKKHNPL